MTAETLRILVIQPDIGWNEVTKNLDHYSSLIQDFRQPVDMILLPEMFTTGFITHPKDVTIQDQDAALSWMRKTAADCNSSIAGSMIVSEYDRFYNRLVCMHPSAETDVYNKRHLFRMGGEEEFYTGGTKRTVSLIKGWRICWQICYDLRFPVWSRNQGDYDVLVYASNWPSQRSDVWNILLKARAIENQSYTIGVNRVGTDGNNIHYLGESAVIDPKGNVINDNNAGEEKLIFAGLSYATLTDFRSKFPVLQDADKFTLG
jgi:omega-amidase